ncbi:ASNSD1 upstream open reading frame protein-like [Branchiostoma floridae]|uniref:ASNSD1 upstream open reading frame protein-like n=2 Tax=Branchiostoma TaxID=7737 RepID=A0A9J7LUF3_BRAFL|nr:ASNSD1 upstream open reading frame protein-like [Branchiostoma floridae]CAH1237937.1 Hypp5468 [Branchiostoma lanceolatum]
MATGPRKDEVERQMNEQTVLEIELRTVKQDKRVYKQQQNSNVFFREDKTKLLSECKKTMDELRKEYQEIQQDAER